jgi:hypothetical protein
MTSVDGASPHPFRLAAERDDVDALVDTLAPDVVLHSPVTFAPYVGKETVGGLVRLVSEALEGWRCVTELQRSEADIALVFRARVGAREIEGLDLLRLDAAGLVAELTVMCRPLSGLIALAQTIGPKVDAAGLTTGADPTA